MHVAVSCPCHCGPPGECQRLGAVACCRAILPALTPSAAPLLFGCWPRTFSHRRGGGAPASSPPHALAATGPVGSRDRRPRRPRGDRTAVVAAACRGHRHSSARWPVLPGGARAEVEGRRRSPVCEAAAAAGTVVGSLGVGGGGGGDGREQPPSTHYTHQGEPSPGQMGRPAQPPRPFPQPPACTRCRRQAARERGHHSQTAPSVGWFEDGGGREVVEDGLSQRAAVEKDSRPTWGPPHARRGDRLTPDMMTAARGPSEVVGGSDGAACWRQPADG